MHFTTATALVLPALAASMALPSSLSPRTVPLPAYVLIGGSSGYASIDGQVIQANGGNFYIGKPASTVCASNTACPTGLNTTVVMTAGFANLSTPASNTGGDAQRLYVSSAGALSYTAVSGANSSVPSGGLDQTFLYSSGSFAFPPLPPAFEFVLNASTQSSLHFFACPLASTGGTAVSAPASTSSLDSKQSSSTVFQIFVALPSISSANVPTGNLGDCKNVAISAITQTGNAAEQGEVIAAFG